jgi:hypothetical protein
MAVLTPTAKTMEVGLRVNADNINQIPWLIVNIWLESTNWDDWEGEMLCLEINFTLHVALLMPSKPCQFNLALKIHPTQWWIDSFRSELIVRQIIFFVLFWCYYLLCQVYQSVQSLTLGLIICIP